MSAPRFVRDREHDNEPQRGLPQSLPQGESLLWQGSPDWRALAVHVFHVRFVAGYFALLALWRGVSLAGAQESQTVVLAGTVWMVGLGAVCLGLLLAFSVLIARTSVYSLTNKRLVLRVGVALEKAVNIPFSAIETAHLRAHSQHAAASGDLAVALKAGHRVGYVTLWPHVRPFQYDAPQPMLRGIPEAAIVARHLAEALSVELKLRTGESGVVSVPNLQIEVAKPRSRPGNATALGAKRTGSDHGGLPA
jgi:hypothetical protein